MTESNDNIEFEFHFKVQSIFNSIIQCRLILQGKNLNRSFLHDIFFQSLHPHQVSSSMTGQMFKCFRREGRRGEGRMGGGFLYFSDTDLHGFTQIRCCIYYTIYIFQQPWRHSTDTTTEYNFPAYAQEIYSPDTMFIHPLLSYPGNHCPPRLAAPGHPFGQRVQGKVFE